MPLYAIKAAPKDFTDELRTYSLQLNQEELALILIPDTKDGDIIIINDYTTRLNETFVELKNTTNSIRETADNLKTCVSELVNALSNLTTDITPTVIPGQTGGPAALLSATFTSNITSTNSKLNTIVSNVDAIISNTNTIDENIDIIVEKL